MFAFALWDKKLSKLYLVRDRIGVKPLYYGKQKKFFYFSSELNAIKHNLNIEFTINKFSLKNFEYSYISTPDSIYNEIRKLEPGYYLEIDSNYKLIKNIGT